MDTVIEALLQLWHLMGPKKRHNTSPSRDLRSTQPAGEFKTSKQPDGAGLPQPGAPIPGGLLQRMDKQAAQPRSAHLETKLWRGASAGAT